MITINSASQMRSDDMLTIKEDGISSRILMERAAYRALELLWQHFDTKRVLFLCGNGNNGGDGFAMARFFKEQGGNALVCYAGAFSGKQPDTAAMSADCALQYVLLPPEVSVSEFPCLDGVTAVVDALLGIGISRPVTGRYLEIINAVNAARLPVLSIDIPSGICADNGRIMGAAIRASETIAIGTYKYGHLLYPGVQYCGKLTVADIGIKLHSKDAALLEKSDLQQLPKRPRRSHKGTFGRVLVIGGSVQMSGAAHLAAKAAYRAGAGLVEMYVPEENRMLHQISLPEAIVTTYDKNNPVGMLEVSLRRADTVVIGMGLGVCDTCAALTAAAIAHTERTLVLDADALNVIGKREDLQAWVRARKAPTILTPHLAEAARLLDCSVTDVAADLPLASVALAKKYSAAVALKDAHTVITDGEKLYFNTHGSSAMATGGSGDVLAGIIAALAVRNDATAAASLGVLTHALAGEAAAKKYGEHGTMASDIADCVCEVLP